MTAGADPAGAPPVPVHRVELIDAIDALLPQTQCRRCGYDGCRPYAEALVEGATTPDRCPPGGDDGAARLAQRLGLPSRPVDRACGEPGPMRIARIREADCIGCTKCIQACPVDAIVGASRWMHAVIESRCTGCELCIPPCPTDCIELFVPEPRRAWPDADARAARQRHDARQLRLARERRTIEDRKLERARTKLAALDAGDRDVVHLPAAPGAVARGPHDAPDERPAARVTEAGASAGLAAQGDSDPLLARKHAIVAAAIARAEARRAARMPEAAAPR